MVVGITGIYCSGKNTVSTLLQMYGFTVIDVDRIGHEALKREREKIVGVFGEDILTNGQIDRKKLGKLVFSDQEQKKLLEKIVHPWMIREVKRQVVQKENVVINAALLVELCLFVLCDYVMAVSVDEMVAVQRGMKRDGITRKEAQQRISAQIPLKEKLHYVDKIIENNGNIESFETQVRTIASNLAAKVQ